MPTYMAAVVAFALFDEARPVGWTRHLKPDGTQEWPEKGTE